MSNTDTPADRLLAILDLDPSDIAADIVQAADGHDARLDLIRNLLTLAAAVADEVNGDMIEFGNGYRVCPETGDTHAGNGTEDEGRGLALHQFATAAAAGSAAAACSRVLEAFNCDVDAAEQVPNEINAEDYVAKLKAL
jgi:hypothetical protein